MDPRAVRALVAVIFVVSAGCTGMDGSGTEPPTVTPAQVPTGDPSSQVVSATTDEPEQATSTTRTPIKSLDIRTPGDIETAFERFLGVFQVTAPQPSVEIVTSPVERGRPPVDVPDRFEEIMGLGPAIAPRSSIGTVSDAGMTIRLVDDGYSSAQLESHLAYLYAQSLQRHRGWIDPLADHWNGSIDQQVVAYAMTRGGAAVAATKYTGAFNIDADPLVSKWSASSNTSGWLSRAALRVGFEKFDQRFEFSNAYYYGFINPPNTSEQFLHTLSPALEPAGSLAVRPSLANGWAIEASDSLGELTLRAVLATRLDREQATTAVDHWNADRLLVVSAAGSDAPGGFVLATSWDRSGAASEFARAIDRYTAQVGRASPSTFQTLQPDSTTVVVVAGDGQFVNRTSVSVEGGDVFVSMDP